MLPLLYIQRTFESFAFLSIPSAAISRSTYVWTVINMRRRAARPAPAAAAFNTTDIDTRTRASQLANPRAPEMDESYVQPGE